MPKKFPTEHPKAAAAHQRKESLKATAELEQQKQAEDDYWKDDDKHHRKKLLKREIQEKKRMQQLEKKTETKTLLEQELNSINHTKPSTKLTRVQIKQTTDQGVKEKSVKRVDSDNSLQPPLVENLNRLTVHENEAKTVNEVIAMFNSGSIDVQEKSKAVYVEYEARRLKEIKNEFPTMRLSQRKQIIFKEWQKNRNNMQ